MGGLARRAWLFACALIGALCVVSVPAAEASSQPIRVTVVGDSVADSLEYVPPAERLLARGLDVSFDLRVCRRLATTGCPYNGAVPPSVLVTIQSDGPSLGDVLVVDVGYNDDPAYYRVGMDSVIRAAAAAGVQRIIWVTLRETSSLYSETNAVIRSEARKHDDVEVADWNAASAGKPWFRSDGLHLSATGAEGLAEFLRPYLVQAARDLRSAP